MMSAFLAISASSKPIRICTGWFGWSTRRTSSMKSSKCGSVCSCVARMRIWVCLISLSFRPTHMGLCTKSGVLGARWHLQCFQQTCWRDCRSTAIAKKQTSDPEVLTKFGRQGLARKRSWKFCCRCSTIGENHGCCTFCQKLYKTSLHWMCGVSTE